MLTWQKHKGGLRPGEPVPFGITIQLYEAARARQRKIPCQRKPLSVRFLYLVWRIEIKGQCRSPRLHRPHGESKEFRGSNDSSH